CAAYLRHDDGDQRGIPARDGESRPAIRSDLPPTVAGSHRWLRVGGCRIRSPPGGLAAVGNRLPTGPGAERYARWLPGDAARAVSHPGDMLGVSRRML